MADFLQGVLKAFGPMGANAESFVKDYLLPLLEMDIRPQGGESTVNIGGQPREFSWEDFHLGMMEPPGKKTGKVLEGMKHAGSAASAEAFGRIAAGTKYFRLNRAGKVVDIPGVSAGDLSRVPPGEAIVSITQSGIPTVEGGHVVGKAMQDALEGLTPGKARSSLAGPATDIGSEGVEDAIDFLKSLGVEF